jgi:hypothetical protein
MAGSPRNGFSPMRRVPGHDLVVMGCILAPGEVTLPREIKG